MYCAIDTAAAKQRIVGGVDDRIDMEGRDVRDGDFEDAAASISFGNQADAPAATPFSAKSCCSSPAWNISRTMSQPPTNSPFT